MIALDQLRFSDVVALGVRLRREAQTAYAIEDVAERVAEILHRELRMGPDREAATALVRVFVTCPFDELDPGQLEVVRGDDPTDGFLVLAGSAGVEPAWNNPLDSRHHRVMPLTRLTPMLTAALGSGEEGESSMDALGVGTLHVRDARDAFRIPDQDFVRCYGVRSVVAFTLDLPRADRVVIVLFSRVPLDTATVECLRPVALEVWQALLRVGGRRTVQHAPRGGSEDAPVTIGRLRSQVSALRALVKLHQANVEENVELLLRQQESLELRGRRLRAILDTLPDPIFSLGADGAVTSLDAAADARPASPEVRATLGDLARVAIATGAPQRLLICEGTTEREFRLVRVDATEAVCLARDVSELRRAEREAEDASRKAREASRAKSAFLASMSHEIRTPLNGVIGLLELLKRTPLAGDQVEYVQTAETCANHLLELVSDILDLSRVETGTVVPEEIPFELRKVVQDALALLTVRAWEKGLQVEQDVASDVPEWVAGDPLRLRQVLVNLLGNAIKFSERGTIRASVAVDGELLRFSVADQGIGIAPEAQSWVFEPFRQADQSTSRRYGGSGLGLALCRSYAELMGGAIWLESEIGQGTTFHVTARLPAVARPDVESAQSPPSHSVLPVPLRILVAEDSPVNRLVITRLLGHLGHRVEHAENGREAVEAAQRGAFDLILMDLEMPEVDGLTATRQIRQLGGEKADMRIVALTAHATAEHTRLCREAGMDDILTKPIDVRRLEPVLASAGRGKARARRNPGLLRNATAMPPAPPPARPTSSVDRAAAVARLGGDEALWAEIARAFSAEAPRLCDALRAALLVEDAEAAARGAHSLKGALLNLGARIGVESARALEAHAGAREWERAQALFKQLEGELLEVGAELLPPSALPGAIGTSIAPVRHCLPKRPSQPAVI